MLQFCDHTAVLKSYLFILLFTTLQLRSLYLLVLIMNISDQVVYDEIYCRFDAVK